jgi:hypothetical protein
MIKRGYRQSNVDHTLFYKHGAKKVTILIVYVDDIVITGDDCVEISNLKNYLAQEFELKDLSQLRYFLVEILMVQKEYFSLKGNMC